MGCLVLGIGCWVLGVALKRLGLVDVSICTLTFHIYTQVDSLEEADKKIDTLAATGQLDPALMLMMAKAYQVGGVRT